MADPEPTNRPVPWTVCLVGPQGCFYTPQRKPTITPAMAIIWICRSSSLGLIPLRDGTTEPTSTLELNGSTCTPACSSTWSFSFEASIFVCADSAALQLATGILKRPIPISIGTSCSRPSTELLYRPTSHSDVDVELSEQTACRHGESEPARGKMLLPGAVSTICLLHGAAESS